jgi:hypothetical protein
VVVAVGVNVGGNDGMVGVSGLVFGTFSVEVLHAEKVTNMIEINNRQVDCGLFIIFRNNRAKFEKLEISCYHPPQFPL